MKADFSSQLLSENFKTSFSVKRWYVVSVRSRCEKQCFKLLTCKGIESFLPIQKQTHTWSDRKKVIETPLFNGYVFVRINQSERFEVLTTPGVVRFIQFAGKDASIPDTQINAIRNALQQSPDSVKVVDIVFLPGEEVYISSGPFKGNYARLVRHNGKGKLQLMIEHIGKGFLIEIGRTRVQNISATSSAIAV